MGTVVDIVRASYEVISGPAGQPRQWERDKTFYMPGATFVSVTESDGRVQTKIMTPEDYRRGFDVSRERPTAPIPDEWIGRWEEVLR